MACVCPGGRRDQFTSRLPASPPPARRLPWAAPQRRPVLPSPSGPPFQTFSSSVYQPGLVPSPEPLAKFCLAPCPSPLLSLEQEPVGAPQTRGPLPPTSSLPLPSSSVFTPSSDKRVYAPRLRPSPRDGSLSRLSHMPSPGHTNWSQDLRTPAPGCSHGGAGGS